ncbi:MAG: LysR family transcriptional regulator [Sphingobacteriaceae bacterium]|nr:MAG: LysR family transcriptional regulator [Sphingobacteriaceae bacterium]
MISVAHRVFLEVATHLSFSKASKTLFISQPAVSKQIKILEDKYELPLFERKGNSILITRSDPVDILISAFHYQHFINDEVIAVCSRKSVLAGKSLTIEELKSLPLALRERGSGTLNALLHVLSKHQIKPSDLKVKIRLGGTEALKNFLLADEILGFLPRPSILRELKSGELVEVPVAGLEVKREFFFIRRKGSEEYGLTKQFIRFCLQSL